MSFAEIHGNLAQAPRGDSQDVHRPGGLSIPHPPSPGVGIDEGTGEGSGGLVLLYLKVMSAVIRLSEAGFLPWYADFRSQSYFC